MSVTGSWNLFGKNLPEFGLTESLGGNKASISRGTQIDSKRGYLRPTVLGSASYSGPVSLSSSVQAPVSTPTSTGTSSGGSTSKSSNADTEAAEREALFRALDSVYNPVNSYLDQAKSAYSSGLKSVESDITGQYNQGVDTVNQQYTEGGRQLDQQQVGGEQRKEDALTSARRLYNELLAGGQQRFGGASSAGEAYRSLANTELMRNNQQIGTDFNNFMSQIEGARTSLQEKKTMAIQSLEMQKSQMLNDARRNFQNQLLEIDRMKAQASSDKANKKLQALQDLRNQVFQINMQAAQGQQYIDSYAASQEQQLADMYAAYNSQVDQGAGALNNLIGAVPTNYNTSLTMNTGRGGFNQLPMTGIRREDELMQGYTTPRRDDFLG